MAALISPVDILPSAAQTPAARGPVRKGDWPPVFLIIRWLSLRTPPPPALPAQWPRPQSDAFIYRAATAASLAATATSLAIIDASVASDAFISRAATAASLAATAASLAIIDASVVSPERRELRLTGEREAELIPCGTGDQPNPAVARCWSW